MIKNIIKGVFETLAFMFSKVLAEVMAEGVREGEISFRGSKYCDNVTFLQMIYLKRFFYSFEKLYSFITYDLLFDKLPAELTLCEYV